MLMLYLNSGIGEILVESTIYHGVEINIFLNIVDHAGPMEQLALSLIESILPEIELGQI